MSPVHQVTQVRVTRRLVSSRMMQLTLVTSHRGSGSGTGLSGPTFSQQVLSIANTWPEPEKGCNATLSAPDLAQSRLVYINSFTFYQHWQKYLLEI